MRRFVAQAALLGLALAACGGDSTTTPKAGATKVTVKTSEYKFDAPATYKGGLVELTIDNTAGKESHEAEMIRLDPGKTLADLKAAMEHEGPPPAWQHAAGGPGPVLPGTTAVYTANVQAGTYVLVCHVPAPDGNAHLDKGMAAEVTVTEGTSGTLPAGDATVSTSEFKFTGVEGLKAGKQTVRFTNVGKQQHHVAIIALAPGKKVTDALAFFTAVFSGKPPAGPPPFTGFPGLVATMDPGFEGARTLELTAGTTYGFMCFIPDTDGTPHVAKGMMAELTAK